MTSKSQSKLPQSIDGMSLISAIESHTQSINQVAWSPLGDKIASASDDCSVSVWSVDVDLVWRKKHLDSVQNIAWSPDGRYIASAGLDKTLRLWDANTGKLERTFTVRFHTCFGISWGPNSDKLCIATETGVQIFDRRNSGAIGQLGAELGVSTNAVWSPTENVIGITSSAPGIRLLNAVDGHETKRLMGHEERITAFTWSADGSMLAAGSEDATVQIWDAKSGWQRAVLEGHTGPVIDLTFSSDGAFLCTLSAEGEGLLWHLDTLELVAIFESKQATWSRSIDFHPSVPLLAAATENAGQLAIWKLNIHELASIAKTGTGVHYTNAKVVLVGETGVGKSGLALVLSGQPYVPTDSTHGRRVYQLGRDVVQLGEDRVVTRETMLWDMAGQPGYRLVHQLHLNEVAVALVVIDSRSETEPFAGAAHWTRAIRQAERVNGSEASGLKKFLVAARTDRGSIGVSRERREAYVAKEGFDGYIETSAKDNIGIKDLTELIRQAIAWDKQPVVSSTDLFDSIRSYIIREKSVGRQLTTFDDLLRAFRSKHDQFTSVPDLNTQFDTCLGRLQSRGLVRRLSFGNLILIQPELLDAYASALVNAAKDEPDGLGSISEERARSGKFQMSADERISDAAQEALLLIATIEDLINHEIAFRETAEDGAYLVLPSQLTRERPDLPYPERQTAIFEFEGAIQNIYSTMVVRLAHSGLFERSEMWRNASTYTAVVGGVCGMWLRDRGDGTAQLTTFYDNDVSQDTVIQFEYFIEAHLLRRANADSVVKRLTVSCPECGSVVTDQIQKIRRERGYDWVSCAACDFPKIEFDRVTPHSIPKAGRLAQMDRAADMKRDEDAAKLVLGGKEAVREYDLFMLYNPIDVESVRLINEELRKRGLNAWLNTDDLPFKRLFSEVLFAGNPKVKAIAVCIGGTAQEKYLELEYRTFVEKSMKLGVPVVPILLPGVQDIPVRNQYLKDLDHVELRTNLPDARSIDQLVMGIRGKSQSIRRTQTLPSSERRSDIFVSYSHKDSEWLDRLKVHFAPLERSGKVRLWDDTKIRVGQKWKEQIALALSTAKFAILLVSADFLASEFIAGKELPSILASEQNDGLVVMPLILSPCRFRDPEPLAQFQAINSPSNPLISLPRGEQEALFAKLAAEIEEQLEG